jgi:hypothetical protein
VEPRATKTLKDLFRRLRPGQVSLVEQRTADQAALPGDVVSQNRLQYLLVAKLLPNLPNLTLIRESETHAK